MTDPLREKAISSFIAIDRTHHIVFDCAAGEFGIHRGQHRMLMRISLTETPPTQKQLADEIGISPAAVAVMLKKLENAGYIKRRTSKEDSRANDIIITENGKAVVARSKEAFTKIDEIMFNGFTAAELDRFTESLGKMERNLRELVAAPDKNGGNAN